MFTKLFKTEKKTQAPRTARVAPLSDANLEQVTGGISGQISGNPCPGAYGSQVGDCSGTA
jgi:hypothetical protein